MNNAGTSVNARGKLNRANVGAPNQQFKASIGATLSRSAWNLCGLLRHIGEYEDDAGGSIESFTTLDLNAKFSFRDLLGGDTETWVRLGAANLLDEDPPYVVIAGSYDPRSADPRGRRLFVSVGLRL